MTGIPSIASSDFALQIVLRTMQLLLMISVGCFMHRWTEWGVTEFSTQLLFYASVFNEQVAILKEEIYVGGISATKPCRNLLERRKTLLKPTEWCCSILLVCDKIYNTTKFITQRTIVFLIGWQFLVAYHREVFSVLYYSLFSLMRQVNT